ncbi:hypothetical protein NEUTE1DRAFT_125704 [Neurospora tetrasperma FGSC 2508]|uniref:Uncharacterized protein n=1 Tax=Neurospora tetrasperma (strain FGSC 2508 / ATCC MYA-4615 / P0657) TaxID=510951 RepID=F8N0N0_NEUT8|nr:uncharacterized protein NEUTE1DRAFT_125704 [Neurospora tetrasperma FGSC 2508]EGO52170.1 hypothetical protein NEUTE1DRAFT_125704 [Neurospora tetrasperma FGSC 2508]
MVVVFVSARRHYILHPVDTYPPKVEDDIVLCSICDPQMHSHYIDRAGLRRLLCCQRLTGLGRISSLDADWTGPCAPLTNKRPWLWMSVSTTVTARLKQQAPTVLKGSKPHRMEPRRFTGATLCGYHHQPQHYWCCATLITTITAPPNSDMIQKLT